MNPTGYGNKSTKWLIVYESYFADPFMWSTAYSHLQSNKVQDF